MLHKQRDLVFQNDRAFLIAVFLGESETVRRNIIDHIENFLLIQMTLRAQPQAFRDLPYYGLKRAVLPGDRMQKYYQAFSITFILLLPILMCLAVALRRILVVPQSKPLDVRCL